MKDFWKIPVAIGIALLLLSLLNWIFKVDQSWVTVVVGLAVPGIFYSLTFTSGSIAEKVSVRSKKIVDNQTGQPTDQDFIPSQHKEYSFSYNTDDGDSVYTASGSRVMIVRTVKNIIIKTYPTPQFPWLVYTVLSAVIVYALWQMVIHDQSFEALFQLMISRFHPPKF